ncbi:MAG: alpha/beta hydrolase [Actinomycetota bacterium]
MLTWLAVLMAAWLVLLAALWLGQRRLIYLPDPRVGEPPAGVAVAEAETADGVEHPVWIVPARGEARARVVVFNGNAGNRSHRLPLARNLASRGLEVLLFDYRGYGDTAGRPSEAGLVRDGVAVAGLAAESDLPLVYFGESLGAGVATMVATRRPPAALVLRSPFASLVDMARIHYRIVPAGILLRDRFDVVGPIGELDLPVQVILGTDDSIVPPRLSREVFAAVTGPKELRELEGLGHNDPDLTSGEEVAEAVASFLMEQLP